MPIKFSKTHKQVDRATKKVKIVHDYMKQKPLADLLEFFNNTSNPGKKRQKVRNELVRRNKKGLANIIFS
jgi:hypothetical protein